MNRRVVTMLQDHVVADVHVDADVERVADRIGILVDGVLRVELGDDTLPAEVREGLRSGAVRHVRVIGQGTAHVAGLDVESRDPTTWGLGALGDLG